MDSQSMANGEYTMAAAKVARGRYIDQVFEARVMPPSGSSSGEATPPPAAGSGNISYEFFLGILRSPDISAVLAQHPASTILAPTDSPRNTWAGVASFFGLNVSELAASPLMYNITMLHIIPGAAAAVVGSSSAAERHGGRSLLQGAMEAKPAPGLPGKPSASPSTAGGLPTETGGGGVPPAGALAAKDAAMAAKAGAAGPKVDIAIKALNVTGVGKLLTNDTLNLTGGVASLLDNPLALDLTLMHVVPGVALRSTDLPLNQVINATSLLGPTLQILRTGNSVKVSVVGTNSSAEVIKADIPFNKVDIAIKALNATGAGALLTADTVATIFAPDDAAFESLAAKLNVAGGVASLLDNPLALNFTLLHVVPGVALRSTDLPLNQVLNATSLLGPTLQILRTGNSVKVSVVGTNSSAEVIKADIPFNKAIVHVINKVLV
ncbi:hypothetical protein PLESTM_000781300 [Pleodorina starrii]|nr:hypothetical protein PLESTM_000781300 [Pleodorina starrii]